MRLRTLRGQRSVGSYRRRKVQTHALSKEDTASKAQTPMRYTVRRSVGTLSGVQEKLRSAGKDGELSLAEQSRAPQNKFL